MKNIYFINRRFTFSAAQSQDYRCIALLSRQQIGTARLELWSAFGALGGDLSSLNVNPAGSAIFINNQVTHLK
jgi:hypothetical protein